MCVRPCVHFKELYILVGSCKISMHTNKRFFNFVHFRFYPTLIAVNFMFQEVNHMHTENLFLKNYPKVFWRYKLFMWYKSIFSFLK